MTRLEIITSFLGEQRNRYMSYRPDQDLAAKFALARRIDGLDGLEVCYPADFTNPALLKTLLADSRLGVPATKWPLCSNRAARPARCANCTISF